MVCLSVCVSVTIVSPAKTAEQFEMQLWTRVSPRNHMLDGSPDPSCERASFKGEGDAHYKA